MPRHQSAEISTHGRSAGCRVSDASRSGEKPSQSAFNSSFFFQHSSFAGERMADGDDEATWRLERNYHNGQILCCCSFSPIG